MNEELIIDEKNFSQYFRDCRINRPERGDVMARYVAVAQLVDGQMKKNLVDLLSNKDKAYAATQVMRKLGCATQKDAIRVCREMAEDLNNGLSSEEVEKKIYEYELETFFYTKKEYVPLDDPHWSIISLVNLDTFLDASNQKLSMKMRVMSPEETQELAPIQSDETGAVKDEIQV